jgi:hypothetical protein
VLTQVQAEAAATWRAPTDGRDAVRGAERLRAWFANASVGWSTSTCTTISS